MPQPMRMQCTDYVMHFAPMAMTKVAKLAPIHVVSLYNSFEDRGTAH